MTDTMQDNPVVISPVDTKTETARKLIQAWCNMYHHEEREFPLLVDNPKSRQSFGVLVYAIRTTACIDMFPTARLLGIEPADVMLLSRDTRIEVAREGPEKGLLEALLMDAGLKPRVEAPIVPDPRSFPKSVTPEDRRRKKADIELELRPKRRETANQVCELLGSSFEKAFEKISQAKIDSMARYIAIAVVYAQDQRKNAAAIARSLGVTYHIAETALERVNEVLHTSPALRTAWHENIAKVCSHFQIEVKQLMRY
jgi:hypothetical protein